MSDGPVRFSREPYTIHYKDLNGEMQSIRRVPPPKLHEILPEDRVELTQQKNDDFKAGDKFEVAYINPRHPNTLQLKAKGGETTFVEYFDTNLVEEVAPREGVDPRERPQNNRYLTWP